VTTQTTVAPVLKLLDGNSIPHVGLGTWPTFRGESRPPRGRLRRPLLDPLAAARPRFSTSTRGARSRGIVDEAWSPLGAGGDLLRDPVIERLAQEHEVTAAQVVLRWHVQRGTIPIPKSADPQRQAENLDAFGFELSDPQMASLARLDRRRRLGGDPETYEEL
jgi:diketogulonate reductase-like aldo/keto reductase